MSYWNADKLVETDRMLCDIWPGLVLTEPSEADREEARLARDGVLKFEGHQFKVGRKDIDWSAGHHTHQEWKAAMHRFRYLNALAKAWKHQRDADSAKAMRDYIEDWMRQHPHDHGRWTTQWYDNELNIAVRNGNSQWQGWIGLLTSVHDSPAFDDTFIDAVIESVRAQLNYVIDHLTIVGNMRIAEADTLLTVSLRLPDLPDASRWRKRAVQVLNVEMMRQVLPDGAQHERNPNYHQWMTRVFESYWRLARVRPDLGLRISTDTIARMHDYAIACNRPNGTVNSMHDCHGQWEGQHPNPAMKAREKFRRDAGLSDELPPTSQFFPDAGQALLRDSWNTDATYLTFDATTWQLTHCHLSRQTVQLHAHGRTLLTDPGALTYENTDPMCAMSKGTRSHNTVTINGWNQSTSDPSHLRCQSVPGYDLVAAEYMGGYWEKDFPWAFKQGTGRGIWARHARAMFWVHGRFVMVIDSLYRTPNNIPEPEDEIPSAECNWQLSPGEITFDDDHAVTRFDDANLLMLFCEKPDGARVEKHEGERDPERGWLPGSPQYTPAPLLSVNCPKLKSNWATWTTVLIPFKGKDAPRVKPTFSRPDPNLISRVQLDWPDGTRDDVIWTYRLDAPLAQFENLLTDARLIHRLHNPDGHVVQGLAYDATFVDPHTSQIHLCDAGTHGR